MRKDAGFAVDDKIVASISGNEIIAVAVTKWRKYIQDEVLATTVATETLDEAFAREFEVNGFVVTLGVKK